MKTTATDLRTHLYSWLDQVAETGEVLELERKGRRLRIIREEPVSRLGLLPKRPTMLAAPELIAETGWAEAWQPDAP
ncbi:MAG: type II toxin-antitoxin system Phd/YefM family antitoxin [Spirochaetota bacterium]